MHPLPLVDQYGRGVLHGDLGLGAFERHLAAAGGHGVPLSGSVLDSRLGMALRRWCPPLLGLDPHSSAVRYLARRRELGTYTATRRLLRGSGIRVLLAAPAHTPEEDAALTTREELASAADGQTHALVCLGRLATHAAHAAPTVRGFLRHAAEEVHAAARHAAAFVCDGRLVGSDTAPDAGAVRRAAGAWLTAGSRRQDPLLAQHLLWNALSTGRPVQLHCADPAPLAGLLRATAGRGSLVLLPRHPHHRAAARLAGLHSHVYADVGPEPRDTLSEAPFGKLMFGTGAEALPELHVIRARQFTRALERLLREWVAEGECAPDDAARIRASVAGDTARRVYRLPPATLTAGTAGSSTAPEPSASG